MTSRHFSFSKSAGALATIAFLLGGSLDALNAATITTTNDSFAPPGNAVLVDSSMTPLAVGTGFIEIGYFDFTADAGITSDADVSSSVDVVALGNAWVPFAASQTINGGLGSQPGFYSNVFTGTPNTAENIYTLIGNGASLAASAELFVVNHGSNFPGDPGGVATVFIGDVNPVDSVLEGGTLLKGSFPGLLVNTVAGPAPSIEMQVLIPEPSRALLSVVGIGMVCFRRRRA